MANIERAMILAAGLGTRMKPLTNTTPKPLIEVMGKPLIAYSLDKLGSDGFSKVVINMHYLGAQIEQYVNALQDDRLVLSDERDELLDSGGGVVKALPHLGNDPFFILNADSFFVDGAHSNLERMRAFFHESKMDVLLLVASHVQSVGYDGAGDLNLSPLGEVSWREKGQVAAFIYAGVCIVKPEMFVGFEAKPFSLKHIFDLALAKNTLYGLRLDGAWFHVGTPDAISLAEQKLNDVATSETPNLDNPGG